MLDSLLSPDKILLVAVVALVLFGPKRLPQVGRSIGRWLGEFRQAAGGMTEELRAGMSEPLTSTETPAVKVEPVKSVETPAEPGRVPPAAE